MEESVQYGGGCAIWSRVCSMVEGAQFGSVTPSVQRRYIVNTDEGVRHGSATLSALTNVCSTELPELLKTDVGVCLGKPSW